MSERLDNLRLQVEQIRALCGAPETLRGGIITMYEVAVLEAAPALLEALPLLLDLYEGGGSTEYRSRGAHVCNLQRIRLALPC